MNVITPPYGVYFDNNGDLLEGGRVYIGEYGQNPITNPVIVYWDDDQTITAGQPLRTINGLIVRGGTPSNFFINDDRWSILVQDRNGNYIYSNLEYNINASMPPLTIKGNNDATQTLPAKNLTPEEVTSILNVFSTTSKGVVPPSAGPTDNYLAPDATWKPIPVDKISNGNKGDISVSNNGLTWAVNNSSITNQKLANMPALTLKGNNDAASSLTPQDIPINQITSRLLTFTSSTNGLVPSPNSAIDQYLDSSGIWKPFPSNNIVQFALKTATQTIAGGAPASAISELAISLSNPGNYLISGLILLSTSGGIILLYPSLSSVSNVYNILYSSGSQTITGDFRTTVTTASAWSGAQLSFSNVNYVQYSFVVNVVTPFSISFSAESTSGQRFVLGGSYIKSEKIN